MTEDQFENGTGPQDSDTFPISDVLYRPAERLVERDLVRVSFGSPERTPFDRLWLGVIYGAAGVILAAALAFAVVRF